MKAPKRAGSWRHKKFCGQDCIKQFAARVRAVLLFYVSENYGARSGKTLHPAYCNTWWCGCHALFAINMYLPFLGRVWRQMWCKINSCCTPPESRTTTRYCFQWIPLPTSSSVRGFVVLSIRTEHVVYRTGFIWTLDEIRPPTYTAA